MLSPKRFLAGAGSLALVALALTSGPGSADDSLSVQPLPPQPDIQVAPPAPTPDIQVAPPAPTPDIQVAPPAPTPDIQVAPPAPTPDIQVPAPDPGALHVEPLPPQPDVHVAPPAPTPDVHVAPPAPTPELHVAPPAPTPDVQVRPLPPQPPLHVQDNGPANDPSSDRQSRAACAGGSFHRLVGGGINACRYPDGHITTSGKAGIGAGADIDIDPAGDTPDQRWAISGGAGVGLAKLPGVSKKLPGPGVDFGFRQPLGHSDSGTEFVGKLDLIFWKGGITHDRDGWHPFSAWGYNKELKNKKQRKQVSKQHVGGSLDLEFPLTGGN
jgi:hypothetical protein